ncbi:Yip1 member 1 [Tritrichomonas musculus]|uniref:Yip1 member 1 n=1 Tax=Tritrichomonas musculus TaxID=1915356 RepID=A0ABR2JUH4_9EUKA
MNNDSEMQFTEVPFSSMSLQSDLPGGEFITKKTNTFLDTLKKYFNISTADAVSRIINGVMPENKSFLVQIDNNPDIYCPFWLTITVSILCFALGNISVWLHQSGKFVYNFQSFVSTLNLLSLYVFGYPFGIWFYKKSVAPRVVIMISLFGYSTPYLVFGSLLIFLFGFKFGIICSSIIGFIGAYSIFTKFIEYQNSGELSDAGKKLGALVAGPYLFVHIVVSFICFK